MKKTLISILALLVLGAVAFFLDQKSQPTETGVMFACTSDAFLCLDGTVVVRTGPNCEFSCPETETQSGVDVLQEIRAELSAQGIGDFVRVDLVEKNDLPPSTEKMSFEKGTKHIFREEDELLSMTSKIAREGDCLVFDNKILIKSEYENVPDTESPFCNTFTEAALKGEVGYRIVDIIEQGSEDYFVLSRSEYEGGGVYLIDPDSGYFYRIGRGGYKNLAFSDLGNYTVFNFYGVNTWVHFYDHLRKKRLFALPVDYTLEEWKWTSDTSGIGRFSVYKFMKPTPFEKEYYISIDFSDLVGKR